jgi:hypothetical protein
MAGTATAGEIGTVLGICVALVAIFGPITMFLFSRKKQDDLNPPAFVQCA